MYAKEIVKKAIRIIDHFLFIESYPIISKILSDACNTMI